MYSDIQMDIRYKLHLKGAVCNLSVIINCAFYINNKHVLRQGSRSSWEQTDSCLNFWSISKLQPIWISCNSYRYVLCFPSYLSSNSWHSYNDWYSGYSAILEYQDINNTLDQIDSWMTNIETQNDSLVSKLQELLESNRQMRAELQQENAAENNSWPPPSDNETNSYLAY